MKSKFHDAIERVSTWPAGLVVFGAVLVSCISGFMQPLNGLGSWGYNPYLRGLAVSALFLILNSVWAAIFHLTGKLFGGKGEFSQLWKAFVVGVTLLCLLSIPFGNHHRLAWLYIGILCSLMIPVFQELYGLTLRRSFLASALAIAGLIACIAVIIFTPVAFLLVRNHTGVQTEPLSQTQTAEQDIEKIQGILPNGYRAIYVPLKDQSLAIKFIPGQMVDLYRVDASGHPKKLIPNVRVFSSGRSLDSKTLVPTGVAGIVVAVPNDVVKKLGLRSIANDLMVTPNFHL
jgi:hypothetical protein